MTLIELCQALVLLLFIIMLPLFWGVVRVRRLRNRMWWFLERCRACIAFEGDPGTWEDRR